MRAYSAAIQYGSVSTRVPSMSKSTAWRLLPGSWGLQVTPSPREHTMSAHQQAPGSSWRASQAPYLVVGGHQIRIHPPRDPPLTSGPATEARRPPTGLGG